MTTDADDSAPEAVPGFHTPTSPKAGRLSRLPWARLFAEFAVVFLGVTLGLLADDFRESRGEQDREERALRAMLDDLVADSIDLDSLRIDMQLTDESAMWLRTNLGQPDVTPDMAFPRLLGIFNAQTYQGASPTYDGLRSSGELIVIRNDELRRAISYYYDERQQYIAGFYASFGDIWLGFRFAAFQDWRPSIEVGSTDYSLDNFVGLEPTTPWPAMPSAPDFGYWLDEMGVLANVIADRSGDVLEENAQLRRSIAEYLGR